MATLPDTMRITVDQSDFELKHSTGIRHTAAIILFNLARWILGREFEITCHLSFEGGEDDPQ